MGRRLVSTKDMSREDWLAIRKKSIGGSDAGAILGVNEWCSALEVYADKMGMISDKETNESMRLGTDLEEYVAQRFMEATGKKVRRTNFMYQHDVYDFITANVDREVVGENAGLECKTMSPFSKCNVAEGEVPAQYYSQCQHYMAVKGYSHMYLAILVFNRGFYWFRIERNDEYIDSMIAAEVKFWIEHVQKKVPPEPDGSESSMETLAAMHPKDNGLECWLDHDSDCLRYQELTQAIKRMEKQKDEIKARICADLGDYSAGSSDRFFVTWKSQKRSGVDNKYLRENYPKVYEECMTSSEYRVMRIKEKLEV